MSKKLCSPGLFFKKVLFILCMLESRALSFLWILLPAAVLSQCILNNPNIIEQTLCSTNQTLTYSTIRANTVQNINLGVLLNLQGAVLNATVFPAPVPPNGVPSGNIVSVVNTTNLQYTASSTWPPNGTPGPSTDVIGGAPTRMNITACAICATLSNTDNIVNINASLSSSLHAYWPGVNNATAGTQCFSVGAIRLDSNRGLTAPTPSVGQTVVLMQMQGVNMYWDPANPTLTGDGKAINMSDPTADAFSGSGFYTDLGTRIAGNYEYLTLVNYTVSGGGFTVCVSTPLVNTYVARNFASLGGNIYQSDATWQMIRGIQATNLSISNTLDTTPWNGATGGVLVMDVSNTLTFTSNSAKITGTGRGFRGGGGLTLDPNNRDCSNSQNNVDTGRDPAKRSPGEGIAGTPFYTYNSVTNAIDQNTLTYPKTWRQYTASLGSGPSGSGATLPFNSGTGRPWWSCAFGTNGNTCFCNNNNQQQDPGGTQGAYYEPRYPDTGEDINQVTRNRIAFGNAGGYGTVYDAGGGGGSYVGAGGQGGSRLDVSVTAPCTQNCCFNGGLPGATYVPDDAHIIMGGGGGSFGDDNEPEPEISASSGASGGAIVLIRALNIQKTNNVTVSIPVISNGASATNASTACSGGVCTEGRGGGGAGGTVALSANNLSSNVNMTITANGGNGGSVAEPNDGGGGGGGGGFVNLNIVSNVIAGQLTIATIGGSRGTGGTNNTAVSCTNVGGQDGSSATNGTGTNEITLGSRCCNIIVTLNIPVLPNVLAANDSLNIYEWTFGPQPGYVVTVLSNDFWGGGTSGPCSGNFNISTASIPAGWTVNVTTSPCQLNVYPNSSFIGTIQFPYTICDIRSPPVGGLCSTAYVTVVSAIPELTVSKTYNSGNSNPNFGGSLQFDVTITNTQSQTYNNIVVNDTIIQGSCTLTGFTPSNGNVAVSFNGNAGTWTISSLSGGSSIVLSVTCSPNTTTAVTNRACIQSSSPTAPGLVNSACSTATSPQISCITLTKTGNDSSLAPTDIELFTITAINSCSCELFNVTLSDVIPSQLTYTAASFSGSYSTITPQAWLEPFQTLTSNLTYSTGNWPVGWVEFGQVDNFASGDIRTITDTTAGGVSLRLRLNTRGVIIGPLTMNQLCQSNTFTMTYREIINGNNGALISQISTAGNAGPWTTIWTISATGSIQNSYQISTQTYTLPVTSGSNIYFRIWASDSNNNDQWYVRNVFSGSFITGTGTPASPGSFTPLPTIATLPAGGSYNFTFRATRTGVPSPSTIFNTATATGSQCGTYTFSPPSTTVTTTFSCSPSTANYTSTSSFPMTLTDTADCRCNNTAGETYLTAPYDCTPCNNDGICADTENPQTCPNDCPIGLPCNNNARCDSNENFASCPADCTCACNNNTFCDLKENVPCKDCEGTPCIPNGRCDLDENFSNCPADCLSCSTNCMCEKFEREWCIPDCVNPGSCDNDGLCDANENSVLCSPNSCDCELGACNGNGSCEPNETDQCIDCRNTCCVSNNKCEVGENGHNCIADCSQTGTVNGMCSRGETQVTTDCGTCH